MDKYCGNNCNGKYNGTYNANNTGYNANRSRNCSDNNYSRNRSDNSDCCSSYSDNDNYNRSYSANNNNSCSAKFHLHEVQGSVQVVGDDCENHNHRFATVSCEPIAMKNGDHCHVVTFRTDTYNGHYHEFTGRTTEDFDVCDGHVHYLQGKTSEQSGHCHEFKVITHIENPTED